MWPSLETASWLYDWANIGLLAGLVIGVVSTLLIVWMGNVKDGYLKRDVATANVESINARKEVALLQIEIADAKRRQAEAELQLAEVHKRQQPRGLLMDVIIDILRAAPPGKAIVQYQQGLPESALFAGTVARTIRDGGWDVPKVQGVASITEGAAISLGDIVLSARSLESDSVRILMMAFNKAGYGLGGHRDETISDDTILVTICPKL